MSRDSERMIELINELASRAGHLLSDVVPPRAQVHLINAQRELITALVLIYEHRVAGAPSRTAAGSRPRSTRGPGPSARRSSKRTGKIPVD